MKVILLQKVVGLGNPDDIKEVNDGYAVNFLFPKHLAVQASKKAINNLAVQKKKTAKEAENDLRLQQSMADRLDGLEIKFKESVNGKNQLYSAVGAQKISEKLQQLGFAVEKKQIEVALIKAVGDYKAKIKFRHGLESNISIVVSAA